uniref:HAUS augmin-like complex subunit 6 N-terminal domain-containing protein n=1 Tax=Glossina pallidipes TaxID=7398 RepID=A0A1A9Z850_GLOPL
MRRFTIGPSGAGESELSAKLYQKLLWLTKLYPPEERMRKCLSNVMFITVNQTAFLEVLSYLFRIFDAVEFKKRFFWPINDKKSEAEFRANAIVYLKFLNEKYQLNWKTINTYLGIKPAGIKFIIFMMDFVNFIIQELTKQCEKHLGDNFQFAKQDVSNADLTNLLKKDTLLKEYASAYLETMDKVNQRSLVEKTNVIHEQLNLLAAKTGCSVEILLSDNFLEKFESHVQTLYANQFGIKRYQVLRMQENIVEAKRILDEFHSKELTYKNDIETFYQHLPQLPEDLSIMKFPNNLLSIYNGLHDRIQARLSYDQQALRPPAWLIDKLNGLQNELLQMDSQLTDFRKMISGGKKIFPHSTPISNAEKDENNLEMNFIRTPSIKIDVHNTYAMPRISLFDAKGECGYDLPNRDQGPILKNCTLIDPTKLLKTLQKSENVTKFVTTSSLEFKCTPLPDEEKENYNRDINMITKEMENLPDPKSWSSEMENQSVTPLVTPLSATLCNVKTNNHIRNANKKIKRSLMPNIKLVAIEELPNESTNSDNLSTSPSGLLDPLLTLNIDNSLKLNEAANNELKRFDKKSEDISKSIGETFAPNKVKRSFNLFEDDFKYDSNEDALSDTSDSVLNDTIM